MREPRPCVILEPPYWWVPVYNWSYRLYNGHNASQVYVWGMECEFKIDRGSDTEEDYRLSFEDAAQVTETMFITGAYE